MPELPEVQSFASALDATYAGKVLCGITLHRADLRYPLPRPSLESVFRAGALLRRVERVGKQLLLSTDHGAARVSLGMSGAFFPATLASPRKHEHVTLHFTDGCALGYEDARRFGFWAVDTLPQDAEPNFGGASAPRRPPPMAEDAVDATDAAALASLFRSPRFAGARRSVKDALMDQRAIAGIGNIYALEALFRVRLHPAMPCASVQPTSWDALARVVPELLAVAVSHGGESSISTYRRLHGDEGGFQTLHQVYGREGEPCAASGCRAKVVRITQGGRGSFFCPRCQRAPR